MVRRDHPELGGSFDWLIREGRLATVLPTAGEFYWAMLRNHPGVFVSTIVDALH